MASTIELIQALYANPPSISVATTSANETPYGGFLGPMNNNLPIQPWENRRTSLFTMPANFIMNPQNNIANTYTLTMLTANNFLVNYIFPMQVSDQLTFSKTQMIFGPYLPDQVPHLGIVRFVKARMQSSTQTLIRYGLGFQMEHEFMKTPAGVTAHLMHYKQIANAFIEHLQLQVINAILTVDDWERNRLQQLRGMAGASYDKQVDKIMEREKDFWAYVQQTDANAWTLLDNAVEEMHGIYSPQPLTTWIVDHRVPGYCKHTADQTEYALYGPGNQLNVRSGIEYFQTDVKGNRIYSTRSFLNDGEIFNALERVAQIGGYHLCADRPNLNYTSLYSSSDRSVRIPSEDTDSMVELTLDKFVLNCQRFTPGGMLKTTRDLNYQETAGSSLEHDFLYHKIGGSIVPRAFWGQLNPEHFNGTDQQRLAQTVLASMSTVNNRKGILQAIRNLHTCMKIMHDQSMDNVFNALPGVLNIAGISTFTNDNTRSPAMANNNFGSLNWTISDDEKLPKAIGHLPPFYGTYGGFKTLQSTYREVGPVGQNLRAKFSTFHLQMIADSMDAFEEFVDVLDKSFPGSALLNPNWASPAIQNATKYDVAFQNLVGRQFPSYPLYLQSAQDHGDTNRGLQAFEYALLEVVKVAASIPQNEMHKLVAGAFGGNITSAAQQEIRKQTSMAPAFISALQAVDGNTDIYFYGLCFLRLTWLIIDRNQTAALIEAFKRTDSRIQSHLTTISVANRFETLFFDTAQRFRRAFVENPSLLAFANAVSMVVSIATLGVSRSRVDERGMPLALTPLTIGARAYQEFVRTIRDGEWSATVGDFRIGVGRYDTYASFRKNTRDAKQVQSLNEHLALLSKYMRADPQSDPSSNIQNMPVLLNAAYHVNPGSAPLPAKGAEEEERERDEFLRRRRQEASRIFEDDDREVFSSRMNAKKARVRRTFESGGGDGDGGDDDSRRGAVFDGNSYEQFMSSSAAGVSRSERSPFFNPLQGIFNVLDATDIDKEVTPHFQHNFALACSRLGNQPEMLWIVLAWLFTPITEQSLMASYTHHYYHPVNYIIARPHNTYKATTGVKLIPGSETGQSYIAHVNVEIGNDPTVQTMNVAMRAYTGAGVNKSENIFIAPNIMVTEYVMGGGTAMMNPEDYDPANAIYGRTKSASLIFMMTPRNVPLPLVFSLTGTLSWTDPQGVSTVVRSGTRYSYPSAPFYNRIWGFKRFEANNSRRPVLLGNKPSQAFIPNDVMFLDYTEYLDQHSKTPIWGVAPHGHWRPHLIGAGKQRQRLGKDPVTPDNALMNVKTFAFDTLL